MIILIDTKSLFLIFLISIMLL